MLVTDVVKDIKSCKGIIGFITKKINYWLTLLKQWIQSICYGMDRHARSCTCVY